MRRTTPSKPFVASLFAVLVGGFLVFSASSASANAASATFHKGTMTVKLLPDFASTSVWCVAGKVHLSNMDTTIGCAKVKRIVVIGTKKGDTFIGNVNPVDLPNLTSGSFTGNSGDDHLFTGGAQAWTMHGGAGSDTLTAGLITSGKMTNTSLTRNGSDQTFDSVEEAELTATTGDDTINASTFSGPVSFEGGHGNDTLRGGPKDDTFLGLDGNDTMFGGKGNDVFDQFAFDSTESAGADVFNGGPGNDFAEAIGTGNMSATPTAIVGADGDTMSSIEQVRLVSEAAAPTMDATAFNGFAELRGLGAGAGTFKAGPGGSRLIGGDGNDSYQGGAGQDEVWLFDNPGGTLTDSTFTSVPGTDALTSIESAYVTGTNGNDVFDGTAFSGPITYGGNYGTDTVATGPGNDYITQLTSGSVSGGTGTDTIYANVRDGATLINGELQDGDGGDVLLTSIDKAEMNISEVGDDTIDASGWTRPLDVDGSDYVDTVLGGSGPDKMRGWDGNDVLQGNAGDDTLIGDDGNDTLNGGANHDICIGGKGTNTFPACEIKY